MEVPRNGQKQMSHEWEKWFEHKDGEGWEKLLGNLDDGLLLRLFRKESSGNRYWMKAIGVRGIKASSFSVKSHKEAMKKADEIVMEALVKEKERINSLIKKMGEK
jgi:hypothetical protein